MSVKVPKKLIEVALPLDDINVAAAREKSIRHGHPSTLHLWWARRPLAAARAVLFAQMVNDPGGERGYFAGKSKDQADREREALFDIIRDLVKWENTTNERVLERARVAIRKSWRETCDLNKKHPQAAELFNPDKLPAFHDPFAGGGAIPLEAQRLGLEAYASDLNPVAVTINKAMIEIPPRFAGQEPVGPIPPDEKQGKLHEDWSGAKGLAEDVRRYGAWMRAEAEKRIGHLYPKIAVTAEMAQERSDLKPYVGQELTVISWLWARTVKSPNPAFSHADVPLVSTFVLSSKAGKDTYVEPLVEGDNYRFTVKVGRPPEGAKAGTKISRGSFRCIFSDAPIKYEYIDGEACAGRMGARLLTIVAEGSRGRVYLSPTEEHEAIARQAQPQWQPETACRGTFASNAQGRIYGFKVFGDYFTPRQLVALTTYSDLVHEAIDKVHTDALVAGMPDDGAGLDAGAGGAKAYAQAVGVYLGLAVSKMSDAQSSLCRWKTTMDQSIATFGRQGLPMVWDYSEANAFCGMAGDFGVSLKNMMRVLNSSVATRPGHISQADAQSQILSKTKVVSTDPPYYDNIGYADLSDYFYVWLRKCLKTIFPNLYATLAVPKTEELVATPYRHGGKDRAEAFFLDGMTKAIHNLAEQAHPAFPVTIYYAFKQSDTKSDSGTVSTGWETFLEAVLRAGFAITGTWPMRTELGNRMIGSGTNALASSIVLVCSKRTGTETISRRHFQRELRERMPEALETMIGGQTGASPIAPVDLAQAAIGPGMAIFSKYEAVLESDGSPMSVHSALIMINKAIDEFFSEAEGELDEDSRFCVDWFQEYGWGAGQFGLADQVARAKGTTVAGVKDAGVVESGGGKVRLLKWREYPEGWDPEKDKRTPVWEAAHHMIRVLNQRGEAEAGGLLARMPERAEPIRQLAYRLYTLCERKGWAEEARAYNELIASWHSIVAASHEVGHVGGQAGFDF